MSSSADQVERMVVLLKATKFFLRLANDGTPVHEIMIPYDGTHCDAECLMEDIWLLFEEMGIEP